MSNGPIISLVQGFKDIKHKGVVVGQKSTIDIQVTVTKDAYINLDERTIAASLAQDLQRQFQQNMLDGLKPDGTPLPAIAASTVERRAYREAQAGRGGQRSARYKNPLDRAETVKRFNRRFTTVKLGKFTPGGMPPLSGLESGTLVASMKVANDGDGFKIYFANVRAVKDKTGQSAVERVLRKWGTIFSEQGMNQIGIRRALQKAVDMTLANDIKQLLKEAKKVIGEINQIGAAVADT